MNTNPHRFLLCLKINTCTAKGERGGAEFITVSGIQQVVMTTRMNGIDLPTEGSFAYFFPSPLFHQEQTPYDAYLSNRFIKHCSIPLMLKGHLWSSDPNAPLLLLYFSNVQMIWKSVEQENSTSCKVKFVLCWQVNSTPLAPEALAERECV